MSEEQPIRPPRSQEEKGEKRQEKEEKSWEEKWQRDPLNAAAWALILIWGGIVLLASNLGLLDWFPFLEGWSLFFLGAGAILRHGATVRGLTTAASLWAVAAIGMASGLGRYDLAVATTVVVIVSLYLLRFIEHMLIRPRAHERMKVEIRFRERGFGPLTSLMDTLDAAHIIIHKMSADETDPSANTVHMELELPKGMIPADVVRLISQGPAVEGVAQG